MKTYKSYQELRKPFWAPPAKVFGPVWTFLYVLIAISYGFVIYLYLIKEIPFIVLLPFLLNIIFNLSFTPIQFGLKNNVIAAVDTLLILGTLIWAISAIFYFAPGVTFINIPYLLWVCFATTLQFTITKMNW